MKIYTSYFGALKKLPKEFVPVAICGKMAFPWSGLRYPKLAPRRGFFEVWKKTHDNGYYVSHYEHEVLQALTPKQVRQELAELVGGDDKTVVLTCYETPEKFCHRHLVAKWLGKDVVEWPVPEKKGLFERIFAPAEPSPMADDIERHLERMDEIREISRHGEQVFAI